MKTRRVCVYLPLQQVFTALVVLSLATGCLPQMTSQQSQLSATRDRRTLTSGSSGSGSGSSDPLNGGRIGGTTGGTGGTVSQPEDQVDVPDEPIDPPPAAAVQALMTGQSFYIVRNTTLEGPVSGTPFVLSHANVPIRCDLVRSPANQAPSALVNGVTHAYFQLNRNCTFTYKPKANYSGIDRWAVKATRTDTNESVVAMVQMISLNYAKATSTAPAGFTENAVEYINWINPAKPQYGNPYFNPWLFKTSYSPATSCTYAVGSTTYGGTAGNPANVGFAQLFCLFWRGANGFVAALRREDMPRTTGFFDRAYYLRSNPDIEDWYFAHPSDNTVSPLEHFLVSGVFESRKPNELWDEADYLARNPDIVTNGLNTGNFSSGFEHFVTLGCREAFDHPGRNPKNFDEHWYRTRNNIPVQTRASLSDAEYSGYVCGYEHYLAVGRAAGFCPTQAAQDAAAAAGKTNCAP